MNKIIHKDCIEGMRELEKEVIDLTVTSPPYDDLRTYNDGADWNFNTFSLVAHELYRVT